MEHKSFKILIILLFILFVSFIGGAAYILIDQDKQISTPIAQPESINQPGSSDISNAHSATSDALSKESTQQPQPPMMMDTPMARPKKPQPHQVPRQLTEEQKEENLREIAKMAEALPDNMWVPKDPTIGFSPDRGEKLRKSIELSDKIRKETATPQEQQEYYTFKLKETTDKIELIRYIASRTEELSGQSGKEYLTESDVATGEERIEELEQLAGDYQQKLDDIDSESP
jgi:hypothetical protein